MDDERTLSFSSDAHLICVPQGQGAKDAFQKGFRDKLKKKNRYARSVPVLRSSNQTCLRIQGELRTVAEHLLTQICHTLGIPLISFRSVCWMRSISLSCLYANENR